MAFAYAVSGSTVVGNLRMKYGTFTNSAGDTGGDIDTGLNAIVASGFNVTSHVDGFVPKNTISGGTMTIDIPDNIDGLWWAMGK